MRNIGRDNERTEITNESADQICVTVLEDIVDPSVMHLAVMS